MIEQLPIELLQLSEDGKSVCVIIRSTDYCMTLNLLKQLFNNSSWCHFKLDIDALKIAEQSFKDLNLAPDSSNNTTEVEEVEDQGDQLIQIATLVDAQISIEIDDEKINAKAIMVSAYGGKPITASDVIENVKAIGITTGIDKKIIKLLLKNSHYGKPGAIFTATIAKGIPALPSTNAILKRLVQTPKERTLKPATKKNDKVDMLDLGQVFTVGENEILMRKEPVIEGRDGLTVTGEIIPFKKAKDITLTPGTNTIINEKDENELLSTLAGIPKLTLNGMSVDEVLLIDCVDPGSGHVDYKGSIMISGNISDNMHVKATGDITVAGFIESAHIDCGGDLIVEKGIIGQKTHDDEDLLSCSVACEGSVIANYSQYTNISCGGDVHINKQLLHCNVTSKGNIDVQNTAGTKGSIFGGCLTSSGSIHTVILGSSAGAKTSISLIGEYAQLLEDKRSIQEHLSEYKLKSKKLFVLQQNNDCLPPSEKKQLLDFQLMEVNEDIKKNIYTLTNDLSNNKEQLQTCSDNNRIIVLKELHQDVHINIGNETFQTYKNYDASELRINEGKIQRLPYKKP